jgi:hypothetical protein
MVKEVKSSHAATDTMSHGGKDVDSLPIQIPSPALNVPLGRMINFILSARSPYSALKWDEESG